MPRSKKLVKNSKNLSISENSKNTKNKSRKNNSTKKFPKKKTKKISTFNMIKQDLSVYWNHKMSRSHVACSVSDYIKNFTIICKKAPVTGRTLEGYKRHLFPDIKVKTNSQFLDYFKNKIFLDIGSGINHIFNRSLLSRLLKRKYKAMGMDLYKFPKEQKNFKTGSVLDTGLRANTYDVITSQYFLYYWMDEPDKLLVAFRELNRILIPGGTIRIYPVYYGNYHYNNEPLIKYLEKHFTIKVKKPKFYRERVAYIYPGEGAKDIKLTDWDVPRKEKEDAENLEACTLILKKKYDRLW